MAIAMNKWIMSIILTAMSSPALTATELTCPVANCDKTSASFSEDAGEIGKRPHYGIDLPLHTGTPVMAAANGSVEAAAITNGYGVYVVLNHGDGMSTNYRHLSRYNVTKGQTVKQGEVIGYSGNTGISTGPHLHFGVLQNGKPVDPSTWLRMDRR